MTVQSASNHEPSPTKPSPHRKKSRPSDRSPIKPKYLDEAMTQVIDTHKTATTNTHPRTSRNDTPYPDTHMNVDSDESYHDTNNDDQFIDQELEDINNDINQANHDQTAPTFNNTTANKDTNEHDDHDNRSQANTHYSDRSVTPIEEGDEQDFSKPHASPEHQYDDQSDEITNARQFDTDADSFTLRKTSSYSVPPYNPAPKLNHQQGRGGYGEYHSQDRRPDGPILTVLSSSRRSTTLRERED